MKKRALIFLVGLTAGTGLLQAAELRTFKDTQGREMQAKLTRVSGDDVYIERIDGLSTRTDISIYSEDDQKFIRDWAKKELLKAGAFEVRFTTENDNKKKSQNGGIIREEWQSAYGIVLTNTTTETLKNVKVEYVIFKYKDAIAAQKRSEGKRERIKGEIKLPLIRGQGEEKLVTEKFPMLETKLAPNWNWANGGKEKSKDTLDGIWIKVYVNGVLTLEDARPLSLMRTETW